MTRRFGLGKTTCEACLAIDVTRWHRENHLRPGAAFTWVWSSGAGVTIASIGVTVQAGALILSYSHHGKYAEQRIALTTTACPYGGTRPWFCCPGCGKRAGKLHNAGHPATFACRRCHDLAYVTQQEGPKFRGLSRANRLRAKLGGQPGMDAPISPKPTGMHRRTYGRTVETIRTLEAAVEARAFG